MLCHQLALLNTTMYSGSRALTLAGVLLLAAATARAEEKKPSEGARSLVGVKPSLDCITWADRTVSLADLRGKTVVVFVYVTDRPAEWTGTFLAQLKTAVKDKPIVVLAINADKKAELDLTFMKAHNFNGPNIVHGRGPLLPARLGMTSEYFQYVLIGPSGTIAESGTCGMHYNYGATQRYALPKELSESRDLGECELISDSMSDHLKEKLWPYELGQIPTEKDVKKLGLGLDGDEQKLLDGALDHYLQVETAKFRKDAEGAAADRLAAFDRARLLYATFKAKDQAAELKTIGQGLRADASFTKELNAKRAYEKGMERSRNAKNAEQVRRQSLLAIARQYKGTYYGDLAAGDGKTERPASIHTWKDFTPAEVEAALKKQKAFFDEVSTKIPSAGMRMYETKRFLFFSDLPAAMINSVYLPYLDTMYTQLCAAYGIDSPKNQNIWRGKATIVAFAQKSSFVQFESTFFGHPAPDETQGLAHNNHEKNVIISCYSGTDPEYFAIVLVHETAHGFSWCYRSAEALPNWLNEGASEWIAHRVVTGDKSIPRKIQRAAAQMASTHSLGGDFYTAVHIASWQYGAAASITDFLLNYEPPTRKSVSTSRSRQKVGCYRKLIDGIKDGLPWEDALRESFGMTPEQLAAAYGKSVGIPDLKP